MQKLIDLVNNFKDTLKEAVKVSRNFATVKIPTSIDPETYSLDHPNIEFLIFTGGVKFLTQQAEASITQKQDNQIEVWVVCRKTQKNVPEEYIDFAINTYRGKIAEKNNVKSAIFPELVEFVYEKNGVWFYRIPFTAPNLNQITF